MNLLEQLSTTARINADAPDAILFDELSKTVEKFNKDNQMKLYVSNEVYDYVLFTAWFKLAA